MLLVASPFAISGKVPVALKILGKIGESKYTAVEVPGAIVTAESECAVNDKFVEAKEFLYKANAVCKVIGNATAPMFFTVALNPRYETVDADTA